MSAKEAIEKRYGKIKEGVGKSDKFGAAADGKRCFTDENILDELKECAGSSSEEEGEHRGHSIDILMSDKGDESAENDQLDEEQHQLKLKVERELREHLKAEDSSTGGKDNEPIQNDMTASQMLFADGQVQLDVCSQHMHVDEKDEDNNTRNHKEILLDPDKLDVAL